MTQEAYQNYLKILQEELVPALGCTEPIAIAFAAAKARDVLGMLPDRTVVECSGNIIKNVKGVIVPATKNLRGMEAAAIIGIVGGDPSKGLEVLSGVSERHLAVAKEWLSRGGVRRNGWTALPSCILLRGCLQENTARWSKLSIAIPILFMWKKTARY